MENSFNFESSFYFLNKTEILDANNISDEIFSYYLDDNNITLLEQPELIVKYKIYDMNTLLPVVIFKIKIEEDEINEILKGQKG
jgi:hypothetical protein